MDGMKINPNLQVYLHKCTGCDRTETLTTLPVYGEASRPCKCGGTLLFSEIIPPRPREVPNHPLVNFNNWKPDYRQMDGEKEATAAGMYE